LVEVKAADFATILICHGQQQLCISTKLLPSKQYETTFTTSFTHKSTLIVWHNTLNFAPVLKYIVVELTVCPQMI